MSRSSAGGHALEETAAIADAYTVNARQRLRNLRCHGPRPFSGSLCSGGHRLSQLGVGGASAGRVSAMNIPDESLVLGASFFPDALSASRCPFSWG